jgi:hypothetical protein
MNAKSGRGRATEMIMMVYNPRAFRSQTRSLIMRLGWCYYVHIICTYVHTDGGRCGSPFWRMSTIWCPHFLGRNGRYKNTAKDKFLVPCPLSRVPCPDSCGCSAGGFRAPSADAAPKQIGSAPREFYSFFQSEGLLRLVTRGMGILIRKRFRSRDNYLLSSSYARMSNGQILTVNWLNVDFTGT